MRTARREKADGEVVRDVGNRLFETADKVEQSLEKSWLDAGILSALSHHVVGLELVVVHGVGSAPQVQTEGAENRFAPALDDGLAVGLKASRPVL